MSLLDNLNENQKEAVLCTDRHLRIIAGAGSGKTRVITTRIAYLIQEGLTYPNRVLAITFTNKAANEMKERVQQMLGPMSTTVQISTIHSFCVRLLREDIHELGYPRNFTILDSDDQKSILKRAYKELQIDVKAYSYGAMIGYISNNKTALITAEMAKKSASGWSYEETRANVYAYYEAALKDMMALDFDDLLIFTYHLLNGNESIREKWQRRFSFLHVDEFQDVDALQYHIVKLLAGKGLLCVVGDPDQTIYTWRGAQVDIIMNFEKDFPGCKTVVLNENYRSAAAILAGANALIKNNRNRIDKDLFTRNQSDAKIVHFSAMDEANEPVWVAARIKAMHTSGIAYRDMAVLYRSNFLSRGLEKAFLEADIPYRIYGGIRFYDRAEIKDALSYLRLLAAKNDIDEKEMWKNLVIQRVINTPKRGVGAKTLEQIEAYASMHQINLYEALKQETFGTAKVKRALCEFVDIIERYRDLVKEYSIMTLLQKLLEEVGYFDMLQESKEIERLENIKELLHDIDQFEQNNHEGGLDEYLQMISLYSDANQQERGEFVQLMTIHAAKGLEFDNVFVYNVCEGIFPNERSIAEGGQPALEEERRLAYVAFTRAKKQLFISDSQGYSYVLDKIKTTSRFVRELPEEYIEEVGAKPRNAFSSDTDTFNGRDFLSQLPINDNEQDRMYKEDTVKAKKKKDKLCKGDLVIHTVFGEGIVIAITDDLASIAFDKRYGIRKIMASHPSLSKK